MFRNVNGTEADPQTVKVYVKDPTETVTIRQYGIDAEVVKESTGRYYIEVDASIAGRWSYRWESTGIGKAASERQFVVEPSNIV
ncbi:MAG: hypothetical protein AB7Q00_15955 [Phycisphaerales bacterium]